MKAPGDELLFLFIYLFTMRSQSPNFDLICSYDRDWIAGAAVAR